MMILFFYFLQFYITATEKRGTYFWNEATNTFGETRRISRIIPDPSVRKPKHVY